MADPVRNRPLRSAFTVIALIFGAGCGLSCGSTSPLNLHDGGGGTGGASGAVDAPVDRAVSDTSGGDGTAPDGAMDLARDQQLGNIGATCSVSGDCGSGHCFDGVCCQADCSAACHSCALPGSVGTCALADVGTDPRNDCDDEGSASCGFDGTCDGSGACRKYPTGIVCKTPSCSGSTLTLASRCTGGVCTPTSGQPCDPYVCGTAATCGSTCITNADCTSPNICNNGSCGKRSLGTTCATSDDCNSGICQQGVCCSTTCTGSCKSCALPGSEGACTNVPERQDPLDQCTDTGATSCGTDGTCDGAGACRFYAKGTTCRAVAGVCDTAETCAGGGAPCPADGFSSGNVCRASAGICDLAETCSGTSAACPTDALAPSGTVCRQLAGICDVAETCSGTGVGCPTDGFASATTICRASAGACDLQEACSGTGAACPVDHFAATGTVCRVAAGGCDVAETCSGAVAACPPDGFLSAGTVCRAAAGTCDAAEICSGTTSACPADSLQPVGTVCRASAGPCDIAESCSGSTTACPPDGFVTGGTVCRASAGICDVAETCSGSTPGCPADGFIAGGTACRGSAGICDVAEACTGSAAGCPADGFVAGGTVCRGAIDLCDAVESCTGSGAACPPDGLVPSGTVCRGSAGVCDVAETCTGSNTACPLDGFATSGTVCRFPASVCDVAETCTGSAAGCPTDTVVAAGSVVCRAAAGGCDLADSCDGVSNVCPIDAMAPTPTAPANLAASRGNNQATLTWTAVTGATSYTIGRSAVSGGPYTTVGTATAPIFVATGLTNGTTFFFVVSVTTIGPGCVSPNSAQAAVIPSACAGVYCDDFEAETVGTQATGWTRVGGSAGDWLVTSAGTKFFSQVGPTSATFRAAFSSGAPGAPWSGATSVSADVELNTLGLSGQAALLCVRYVDTSNFYCAALSPTGIQIQTKVGGNTNNSAIFSQAINTGSIQQVKLSLSAAGVLSVTLNNSVRGTLTPTALANGFVAVATTSVEASFDTIVVSQP